MRLLVPLACALVLSACGEPAAPVLPADASVAAILESGMENPALTERLGARLSVVEGEALEAELDAAGFTARDRDDEGCAVRRYEGEAAERYLRDATLRVRLADCDDKDEPLRYEVMTVNFGDA
ncbi:hypothetical protein [Sphingomicrobium aestuariivivum]|uniref:hypothetical protein n=1 Tax=Sphingomicrobium aestuariivivum TaxID=1582356 RepID=UPI001FD6DF5E|nr:hypothetical protein [Sphingomicrobium aestuariivivum]MCJ8191481.1 hypothetical protein [Sphingomicrobium aestuariivivum]